MSEHNWLTTLGNAPPWHKLTILRTGQPIYKTDNPRVVLDEDGMEMLTHGATYVRIGEQMTPEQRMELLMNRHPWNPKRIVYSTGTNMRHEHLPALNRYTSQSQYNAMQEIKQSRSITPLLMQGQSSKTVGSLLRNAWVKAENYTDDAGVMREGWSITDAGAHAMKLYEAKLEEIRKANEIHEQKVASRKAKEVELRAAAVEYYKAEQLRVQFETKCNRIAGSLMALLPEDQFRLLTKQIYEKARHDVLYPPGEAKTVGDLVDFNSANRS